MGIGRNNKFLSNSQEYSSPISLVRPLVEEFDLSLDVCATPENTKCTTYFTKNDDAMTKKWVGNCWMNPPFGRNISRWVLKAYSETLEHGGTKVCLIPVRSNTKWWAKVCNNAEIRFIIGEVIFENQVNGLWLPMCVMIFGERAKMGTFSTIIFQK